MPKKKKKRTKTHKMPNGEKITIKASDLTVRNLFHFEHQLKTRMQIQEDKRFKKPKHKKRNDDESFF